VPGVLRNYKAGSVIYFMGDVGDNIYVLKSGAVSLISHSIETGEEVRETLKSGEFFGVKSALAKRPREETALVIKDSQILVLTEEEFEKLITSNIKIITTFLRVFSNQLRKIGKYVHSFLNHTEVGDTQVELFKIGEYYLKNHKYKQAKYVYETYLKHYKNGTYAGQAAERLKAIENILQGKGTGTYTDIVKDIESQPVEAEREKGEVLDTKDIDNKYYDAISLFSQEKYEDAFKLLKALHSSSSLEEKAKEYVPKIEYEMGRCLLAMKKYLDAIKVFTNMIKRFPKDDNVKDALFNIGLAYKQLGEKMRAVSFFEKVLKMSPQSPIDRKARKELAQLKSTQ